MELDKLTLNCFDRNTQRYLLQKLRYLHYEEALHCSNGWRLEYRIPDSGEIHYLLVRQNEPVALQYVRATSWLNEVQNEMAFILTWLGFTAHNTQVLEVGKGQRVSLAFGHNRLPHMCEFEFWHDVSEDDDLNDKLAYLKEKQAECRAQYSQWEQRLEEVSDKINLLTAQRYLLKNNIDLAIGDKLILTPQASHLLSQITHESAVTPDKVGELRALVWNDYMRQVLGIFTAGGSAHYELTLPHILDMREAYLNKFPRARRNRILSG